MNCGMSHEYIHAIDRWEKKKEWQDTYTVAWETFYPIVPTEKKDECRTQKKTA